MAAELFAGAGVGAGISWIVALARAGFDSCLLVKENKQQAGRIAERLLWIIQKTDKWERIYCNTAKSPDHNDATKSIFGRLEQTLIDINYVMEEAAFGKKHMVTAQDHDHSNKSKDKNDNGMKKDGGRNSTKWYRKLYRLSPSMVNAKDLSRSMELLEQQLNNTLSDLHLDQTSSMMDLLQQNVEDIRQIMEQYGLQPSPTDPQQTNQEQIDTVLNRIYADSSEVLVSNITFSDDDDSFIDAKIDDGIRRIQYQPSTEEVEALSIDRSDLKIHELDLLGEGGFAYVISGMYKDEAVAIKRLKFFPTRGSAGGDGGDPGTMSTSNSNMSNTKGLCMKHIERDMTRLQTEAVLAYRCGIHPNIVQVYGFCSGLDNAVNNIFEQPLLIMERMTCTLFDLLHNDMSSMTIAATVVKDKETDHGGAGGGSNRASYNQLLGYLLSIVRAIEFLHLQGIVHRDIKSLNILLTRDGTRAKLSDFGEAKVKGLYTTKLMTQLSSSLLSTSGPRRHGVAGTFAYQAPELLSEEVQETSRVSDVYSLGVVVWECITNKIPHRGKEANNITLLAALKKHLPMLAIPDYPPNAMTSRNNNGTSDQQELDAWEMMKFTAILCLSRDRMERPTASQIVRHWTSPAFPSLPPPARPANPSTPLWIAPKQKDEESHLKSTANTTTTSRSQQGEEGNGGDGLVDEQWWSCKRLRMIAMVAFVIVLVVSIVVAVIPLRTSSSPSQQPEVDTANEAVMVSPPSISEISEHHSVPEKDILLPMTEPVQSPAPPPPTRSPTRSPTRRPTSLPTHTPTESPTSLPTESPTTSPTRPPTLSPTSSPTRFPTKRPTSYPTSLPTSFPTASPTATPRSTPTCPQPVAPAPSRCPGGVVKDDGRCFTDDWKWRMTKAPKPTVPRSAPRIRGYYGCWRTTKAPTPTTAPRSAHRNRGNQNGSPMLVELDDDGV